MHPHRSYAKVPQEWICRKITPDSLQTGVPRRAPLSAHRGRVRPARCSDNASSARRSSKSSDSGLANSSAHCRSDSNSANRKRANLSCSAWGVRQLYRMPLEAVGSSRLSAHRESVYIISSRYPSCTTLMPVRGELVEPQQPAVHAEGRRKVSRESPLISAHPA